MTKLRNTLLSISLLALTGSALAHAVWLERDARGVQLYYGEYDEAKRESSPGRLDDIGTPKLHVNESVVEGRKNANAWRYAAARGEVRAEALDSPVRDWRKQGIGIVKPLFYARHASTPAALAPAAPLDIVTTGKVGSFRVFLNGKPLAGTKVVVVAPNGWLREIKSDAEGNIELALPWRGLYVLEVTHVLPESGEYNGVAYEGRRLRATLSYQQDKGPVTFSPQQAPEKY